MNEPWLIPKSLWHPEELNKIKLRLVDQNFRKAKYKISENLHPKKIVEIGVRAGYSAWAFLQATPSAKYVGYDCNHGDYGDTVWTEHIPKILEGYDYVVHKADSQDMEEIEPSGFYHIDGCHSFKGVWHDLDLCFRNMTADGYMLVDDIDYLKDTKAGVMGWLDAHRNEVTCEYIKSYRGDLLIWRK